MRLTFSILMIFALSACSIKSNKPDYQYPASSDASGSDWPTLAVTSELEAAGENAKETAAENQEEADRLAARARALKARAARLRAQVAN